MYGSCTGACCRMNGIPVSSDARTAATADSSDAQLNPPTAYPPLAASASISFMLTSMARTSFFP